MTTLLLVRHALCDPVGRILAGRMSGIRLNAAGRSQATALAERLRPVQLDLVISSPLERATETAGTIAAGRGLEVAISERLNELDVGRWAGCEFEALGRDPLWQQFNRFRGETRPPGGETMLEVQARVVAEVEALVERFPSGQVAAISHLDVLRALLCHVLGMPLDHFGRVELAPASVSILQLSPGEWRLTRLNWNADIANS